MKNFLSVVAGLLTGLLLIFVIEYISHKMYPQPPGFDLSKADRETQAFFIRLMPTGAFLMVLLAYSLGAFSGGFVSAFISKKLKISLVVGGVLMLAGIANFIMVPHPVWFVVVSLLTYGPFAFAGGKLGMKI